MNTIGTSLKTGPYLDADPARFRADFDRRTFAFGHHLANDPLFAPERLIALAREMSADPNDVYYDAGDVQVGQRWDEIPACDLSIAQLLHRIETANAWIVLRKVDKAPEYARLLDACMAEIETYLGRKLADVMKIQNALIFMSSPNRITTYHIDRECSCLLQIRGEKTISIFDRDDREVLPEDEIERFWTIDNNAAVYKPELQSHATVVALKPGMAVHLPVNAPHWIQNGPGVSISLNINFHYKDALLADVYRMNYWLRKVGLRPSPPRRSPVVDRLKSAGYGSIRSVRSAIRRARDLRR